MHWLTNHLSVPTVLFIILAIGRIETKQIDQNDTDDQISEQRPQKFQRLFLFSNSILKVTPKIQVPLELTNSVDTGFTIALPIKVKFQSQIELMSDWLKQLVATKANRLTKNFNSLSNILGLFSNNGIQYPGPSVDGSGHSPHSADAVAADSPDPTRGDSSSGAGISVSPVLDGQLHGAEGGQRLLLHNELAESVRSQARHKLYKSVELSHSSLGKSCLQRAICEVAQTPLMSANSGLIGELIDNLLTVDVFHQSYPDFDDYAAAQAIGRNSFDRQSGLGNETFTDQCKDHFGRLCPFSLFNIHHIVPNGL